jgi:hypothetical protein
MNYTIKQISIFAENRPGRLAAIAEALESDRVNIRAFSIAEASGFGVVRALVDDPEKAQNALSKLGYVVSTTEVIGIKMKDEPGGLKVIAKMLGDAGINIEYAYAYTGSSGPALIIRVDQVDEAIKKVLAQGGKLLEAKELA